MTALNSYAVLDYVKELRHYEPDAFVVYSGHNEFYGALGPASAVAFGRSPMLTRALRWVLELRISRVLDRVIDDLRGDPPPVQGKTLMGAMVGRTDVRVGDRVYRGAMDGFEHNLRNIIRAAGDTPVFLCEVVCNLRDQEPFGSTFDSGIDEARQRTLQDQLSSARSLLRQESGPMTLEPYEALVDADTTWASARFIYARALEGESRFEEAAREYRAARDLDGIRFRAPSRINRIIGEIAAESGAVLVPVETAIDRVSAPRAPGADLFFEHVHPRLHATQRIAEEIVEQIRLYDGLVAPEAWRADHDLERAEYLRRTGITELDREIADRRIFTLTHRWPFPESSETYRSDRPARGCKRSRRRIWTIKSILPRRTCGPGRDTSRWATSMPRPTSTEPTCKIFPVVPQRYARAGQIHLRAGRLEEAEALLRRGQFLAPSPVFQQLLAEIALEREQPQEALRLVGEALQSSQPTGLARWVQSKAQFELGRLEDARRLAADAVRLDPGNPRFAAWADSMGVPTPAEAASAAGRDAGPSEAQRDEQQRGQPEEQPEEPRQEQPPERP